MSELRKDPIVGRWVIIAANRAQRPNAFVQAPPWNQVEPCPFCEGQEQQTPAEVFAWRAENSPANGPGWRLRVVPNKFPALEPAGEVRLRAEGMYEALDGPGAHEVVVESPRHLASISDLAPDEVAAVFSAWQQRLLYWKQDPRIAYGMVFKNVGMAAGASMEHTHSQVIVTPLLPKNIGEELAGGEDVFRKTGRCAWCEMLRQELTDGRRIVIETPEVVAFMPFAGRFPFETWVLPKRHASQYEDAPSATIHDLAGVMKSLIGKIEAVLGYPAYNYLLHTGPFGDASDFRPGDCPDFRAGDCPDFRAPRSDDPKMGLSPLLRAPSHNSGLRHFHWHIEVIPILTKAAGFEWGSGFFINPVPPEEAASRLRAH
jgi:UDPglucose--hexose-1-phosphate uridylyltransferase